jgi:hypothetical protein
MQRYADFITYPGTGMWMVFGTYDNSSRTEFYRGLSREQIKNFVAAPNIQLYWIDLGMGVANMLNVRLGRHKSSSATLVTPAILKRYLKE